MTKRSTGVWTGRGLLLVVALLLSACDGGIFGTGGPDDINMSASGPSDTPLTGLEQDSMAAGGTSSNNESDGNTDTSVGGISGTENDNTSGINGASTTDGAIDASSADASSADAGSVDAGATDAGTSDGGAAPDNSEGTDSGTSDSANSDTPTNPTVDNNRFTNNQTSLMITTAAQVNVINTTSLTINVIETGTQTQPLLFSESGIATITSSNSTNLIENETSLDIIDNTTSAETLFSFSDFAVDNGTLSTVLVRENGAQIDAIPLITLTATQDATIARVRVIQAVPYDGESVEAVFNLQSAGANPGGIDTTFGPLSFTNPESNYIDIPNGDYELIDSLGRIENQMLSFSGGDVYTVVLLESSTGSVLVVNDSDAATQ